MGQKQLILRGAFILTAAGFLSRIMGFFYKIFLSRIIGAEGLGIYQLIFPVFALALAFSSSGIEISISHHVSRRKAKGDSKGARSLFLAGMSLSLAISLFAAVLIYHYADFLAVRFLREYRCRQLLQYLAFAIPFASLHSCINGYFMGLKKASVPALSQLLEQLIRIFSTFFVCHVTVEKGLPVTPLTAVIGLIFAEGASALFTLTLLLLEFSRFPQKTFFPAGKSFLSIWKTAAPLSGNRILISFLQSVEAVLIPSRLRLFGYTLSGSLKQYGILSGMALPLVLFPSAITGAVSMMLVPAVSEAHSLGNQSQLRRTAESTVQGSLLLGIFCTGIFFWFGPEIGKLLFDNETAGQYIFILGWICPFLYLGSTLTSMLNGLGKTFLTLLQHSIALFIRILFIWFLIPRLGMTAYLFGLLISQLFMAFFAIFALKKEVSFGFSPFLTLVLPLAILVLSGSLLFFLEQILLNIALPFPVSLFLRIGFFTLIYLFFVFRILRE